MDGNGDKMTKGEILVSPDLEALSRTAARHFMAAVRDAIAARGRMAIALAGGNTPRRLYELLAKSENRAFIPWGDLDIFWTDERAVPPDDPQSNYRMARETLLAHVPVSDDHVHRMPADETDLERAAALYARLLEAQAPAGDDGLPRLDLVLLGMGPDGHTASLFPGDPALEENERLVAPVETPHAGARRLTLTLRVLNAANRVMFLVAGGDKAGALRRVLVERDRRLPAARIAPAGELVWLIDSAAATGLVTEVTDSS